ncbi:hypothetical protein Tco_0753802 [Tanacetum coccineum]
MVAYLERTDRNADIHEIVDFLTTSLIYYALTVCPTIYASYIKQFWNTAHSQTVNDVKQIHAIVDGKTVVISESSVRSDLYFNDEDEQILVTESSSPQNTQTPRQALQEDTQLPQTSVLADEAVFKEWDNRVVRATTTATSLDTAQASGNITKTQSTTMSNDPLSQKISSGVNTPRSDEERIEHQELMDNIPPTPYDSPLSGGYTPGSDEGRPDLHELMAICTKLSDMVLDLEKEKDAQAMEILKLKNRIKKLERKAKSSIPPPKRKLYKQVDSSDDSLGEVNASKQGRNDNNKTEEFNLSNKGSGGTKVFDDTTTAKKDVNAVEPVSTAGDAVTAASVIPDTNIVGPSNVSVVGPSTSTARDIFEDEMMTIADTLVAIRSTRPRTTLVVICDVEEEPRRATPVPIVQSQDKGKSKIVEPEPTPKNPIKAQIQRDAEIAQRLYTHSQLKNKSLDEIQKLYEREQKWINDLVPMDSEEGGKKAASSKKEAASSRKRQKADPDDENVKRQNLEDTTEKEGLKAYLKIVPNEDRAVKYETLATKYPIIDWES